MCAQSLLHAFEPVAGKKAWVEWAQETVGRGRGDRSRIHVLKKEFTCDQEPGSGEAAGGGCGSKREPGHQLRVRTWCDTVTKTPVGCHEDEKIQPGKRS